MVQEKEDGEDQLDRSCEKREVLHRVKEERNVLHTIRRRMPDWISRILLRNCLLKYMIGGKIDGRIEVTGKRGRRHKQLLVDLKERKGYWKFEWEAVDRTQWRTLEESMELS